MSYPPRSRNFMNARPPLFTTLPRHRRSELVISLKNRMRHRAAEFGGRFLGVSAMADQYLSYSNSQWMDITFPGRDRFTSWWTAVVTTRQVCWDKAYFLAYRRWEALPPSSSRPSPEEIERTILRDEPPVIYEEFIVKPHCCYNIGLVMVIDADIIDQTSIEAAIDRFYAIGETDWRSPTPVPRERLPTQRLEDLGDVKVGDHILSSDSINLKGIG